MLRTAAARISVVLVSTAFASAHSSSASSHPALAARDAGCPHINHLAKRQDGGLDGPTTSPQAMNYNCPTDRCRPPDCYCASTGVPGGLARDVVPQFVLFTADDAIQMYTIDAVNSVLSGRKNPNGCPVPMTYFNSIQYTNFSMVTDWLVAGNEIADHTMTHVGDPSAEEIVGCAAALNAFAGVPQSKLTGFRAPFLNYTNEMLQRVKAAEFTYDSSATSNVPVTDPNTDAFWPYTLDYGLASDCLTHECGDSGPKIPGLWEIPMYAIYDQRGAAGAHLMDPWLDREATGNVSAVLTWMQNTFSDHYERGSRQPFGIYTHPTHFANGIPNQAPRPEIPRVINAFLDWAQEQDNVWIVTNEQLIAWMRHPVPASELNNLPEFQCHTPQVNTQICNGIPSNEAGLLEHCAFEDYPWYTCYGCPARQPNPNDPTPEQDTNGAPRYRLPANCSTAFFDPIENKCLCNDETCAFTDVTKPIGPNGSNLTSGGTGALNDSGLEPVDPYIPFNEDGAGRGAVVAFAAVLASLLALAVST